MSFKTKVNDIRRAWMHNLTRDVGINHRNTPGSIDKREIKHILISRPNHRLGNLLLMTPLVEEIINIFPHAKIDLFIKGGLGISIFKNYDHLHLIQLPKKPFRNLPDYLKGWIHVKRTRYDMAVNVIHSSASGRLSVKMANSRYKFFGDDTDNIKALYSDYQHNAKQPVYYFRHCLTKMGIVVNEAPVPFLNIRLTTAELETGKNKLRTLTGNDKKVICLFTNATGEKCYSSAWWHRFYERIQKEFPDFNIIELLPVENISKIDFKAATYSNKDIRDVGSVIANVAIFVGADSGVMHLAGAVHAPTLGFFSVTDLRSYQPYNGKSRGVNTNDSTMDDHIQAMKDLLS